MELSVCSVLLVICAFVSSQTENRLVQTDQGPVRGYLSSFGNFYAFYGIPYASAPTGRDKFKAPQDPPTWTEVFEATDDHVICLQPGQYNNAAREDCLVVNVYIPSTQEESLSVIVYIHGGSFIEYFGAVVSPEYLMEHKVIVVQVNYRLGALGLLCSGNENIPGNAAFKDQVAALRWVQRNIANFGGNPNDVTLAGFSVGSMSVEYQILSPMSNGLFHKAISESGSALTPPSAAIDPVAFIKLFVSDIVGFTVEDIAEAENYLLNATSQQLYTDMYQSYQPMLPGFNMGFTLCVEQEIDGVESFMIEKPLDILNKGNYDKVPYLTGITSEEGTIFLYQYITWQNRMQYNFTEFLPIHLNFPNDQVKNAVARNVRVSYFGDRPINDDVTKEFVDFASDIVFGFPMWRAARLHARNSMPVYMYYFSYIPSIADRVPWADRIIGSGHCSQSFLVNRLLDPGFADMALDSEDDILTRNRLTKLWTDFAKDGQPMVTTSELLPVMWEQLDPERMNYLEINVELAARDHLLQERYQLWDEIHELYDGSSSTVISYHFAVVFSIFVALFTNFYSTHSNTS